RPVEISARAACNGMGCNFKLSSIDIADDLLALRRTRIQVINLDVASRFPWTSSAICLQIPRQCGIVHVTHPEAPSCDVIVLLHCKEPGVATEHKGFSGRPDQTAPKQIVQSHHKTESIGFEIVVGSKVDGSSRPKGLYRK